MTTRKPVDHMAVFRVWKEQQLYPYHPQAVHALTPNDPPRRVAFCQWYGQRCAMDPGFGRYVLFTDEATFTRDGMVNVHNQHQWADVNPYASTIRSHQDRFAVNIWAGIVGDHVIGPYMLPCRLTGDLYLRFLGNALPELLQDVPLDIRRRMWFQHDGAPPHFTRAVRDHLNHAFGAQWIGRGGPIAWPARSPDLTPLDFFVWGHVKSLVYETPVESVEELVARVLAACDAVQHMPGVFERVRLAMERRCRACIDAGGRTFEQFL